MSTVFVIDTVMDVPEGLLPVEIIPGVRMCRATEQQAKWILELHKLHWSGFSPTQDRSLLYAMDVRQISADGSRGPFLDETNWRYYVIAVDDEHRRLADREALMTVAATLTVPLYSSCSFATTEPYGTGERTSPDSFFLLVDRITQYRPNYVPPVFDGRALEEWRETYRAYRQLDLSKHPGIVDALATLKVFPYLQPTRQLASLLAFTIIEQLAIHDPEKHGRCCSLRGQCGEKLPAVGDAMWPAALDYRCFGETADKAQVWKRLYDYRSHIAHGEARDFASGELALLKDEPTAVEFLERAACGLLRVALRDPDGMVQLKAKCGPRRGCSAAGAASKP